MNKFIRWMQSYLLYALPFVLVCMVWSTFRQQKGLLKPSTFLTNALWEALSWNLMLWLVALILFLVLMVALPEVREKTLKRLANLKERDEREQAITGKASRSAYISTLSLIILLLFLSVFSVNVYRVPKTEAVNGRTGMFELGMNFSLLDKPTVDTSPENQILFESKDIPLSKTAIILALLVWQLAVFNITARKENLKELRD